MHHDTLRKLRLLVIGMLFGLTLSLHAIADIRTLDEGFYQRRNLPKFPQNIDRALSASIQLSAASSLECSSVVISPDGYILTALHCVTDCLKQKGMTHKSQFKHYGKLEVFDQTPEVTCKTYEYKELEVKGVRVLYTGRGLFYPDDVAHPEKMPERELQEMMDFEEDYAILKIHTDVPLTCLPVANSEPLVDDWIWGIGYPGRAKRKNGLGSNGRDEYVRFGQVFREIDREALSSEFTSAYLDYLVKRYSSERLQVSNLDIQGGVSGGMVIDEHGELVGITVEGASDRDIYRNAASVELRISAIRESLRGLGADVDNIFNCHAE